MLEQEDVANFMCESGPEVVPPRLAVRRVLPRTAAVTLPRAAVAIRVREPVSPRAHVDVGARDQTVRRVNPQLAEVGTEVRLVLRRPSGRPVGRSAVAHLQTELRVAPAPELDRLWEAATSVILTTQRILHPLPVPRIGQGRSRIVPKNRSGAIRLSADPAPAAVAPYGLLGRDAVVIGDGSACGGGEQPEAGECKGKGGECSALHARTLGTRMRGPGRGNANFTRSSDPFVLPFISAALAVAIGARGWPRRRHGVSPPGAAV